MTSTRRPAPTATLLVLAAATGSFALLQSLITPVLSTIQTEFDTSQNTVTWVMTANLLSAAVFTPILGRLGDARGKKRVLVAVLVALAVGSLLAAIAPSIGVLIVARVIQGAAGAVFPLSYAIIRDEFPAARIAPAIGAISAVIAAGGGLGIVLAGPIVDGLGYAWLFWIPMIVVAAAALAAARLIPESPVTDAGSINWGAAVLLSSGLVSLLLALSRTPESGWTSTSVIGLFLASLVLLSAWVMTELRSANPLIDMRMMRLRGVWTTNLVAMLFGAGQFALFVFVPQFVQTSTSAGYGFGASVTEAGVLLVPMLVAMFAAGLVSGRVEHAFSSKAQLLTASALSVLAFTALAFAHDEPWQVAAAGAVFGAGLGLALTSLMNLIVSNVPASQTGVAGGMNANFRTIGGAIGAAAMGSIVTANLQPSGLPVEAGYVNGFLLLTAISIAAVVAALIVPSGRRASRMRADDVTADPEPRRTVVAASPQRSASVREPDHESTTIRVRALACALLHVVLLAIYPIAALAGRAATLRATHRHGARPEGTRRRRRGFGAELVFAAIEREVIETGGPRTAHRYVYEWDIGPASDLVTPDSAMTILKAAPDLIFPFGVTGGTRIELNQVLDLDDVRWPRDDGNPVLVSQADSTSFTFLTLPGHFRGPGRTIQFEILGRGGRLILRHVGATSRGISDMAYDGGAWFSWRSQAARLRAAITGGAHMPDFNRF